MARRKLRPEKRVGRIQVLEEQRRRVVAYQPPHESKQQRASRIRDAQNPGKSGGRR